jgi:hypothetical protein
MRAISEGSLIRLGRPSGIAQRRMAMVACSAGERREDFERLLATYAKETYVNPALLRAGITGPTVLRRGIAGMGVAPLRDGGRQAGWNGCRGVAWPDPKEAYGRFARASRTGNSTGGEVGASTTRESG